MHDLTPYTAISPVDGRYRNKINDLAGFLSESALINYRFRVEVSWLLKLAKSSDIPCTLKGDLWHYVEQLSKSSLDSKDIERVKEIERTTNHDVKAIEYFVDEKIRQKYPEFDQTHWIHFACTSEDINSCAYALMQKDVLQKVLHPRFEKIVAKLGQLSKNNLKQPMLAFTHGQVASPTTFGKEVAVFIFRLHRQIEQLSSIKFFAKMSGAVGNYNAHRVAFADMDWASLTKDYLREIGVEQNPITTQIESHDALVEMIDIIRRLNQILIDLTQDIWTYISKDYLCLKVNDQETGSSTMPHKVNPIDFENAEGNLEIANGLAAKFSQKLMVSRLQRDLSDSTTMRSVGLVWSYSSIAYESLLKGLDKLKCNSEKMLQELAACPQVLTEAVQTCLRANGQKDSYEALKKLSRGKKLTLAGLKEFINKCSSLDEDTKKRLCELTPASYTGDAEIIAERVLNEIHLPE